MLLVIEQPRVHTFLLLLPHHRLHRHVRLPVDRVVPAGALRLQVVQTHQVVELGLGLAPLELLTPIAVLILVVDGIDSLSGSHPVSLQAHIKQLHID